MKIVRVLTLCISFWLFGCAATPKTIKQDIFVAEWTLVGADQSLAQAYDSGALRGSAYNKAANAALQAGAGLKSAKAALDDGKPTDAASLLKAAKQAIDEVFLMTGSAAK